MRVVYSADALSDIEHILSYLADQSPSAAADVAARIDEAVEALGVFPRAARYDRDSQTHERPIQGLPLMLVYAASDDMVELVAVFHTARDPAQKRRG